MDTAEAILGFVSLWGGAGAVVALLFLTIGIDRIDEDARGAYVFRPLLIPGILLIWPLVIWRWAVLEMGRDDWRKRHAPPRRAHLRAAIAMAVLAPAIFIIALAIRQTWPADYTPRQIAPDENVTGETSSEARP